MMSLISKEALRSICALPYIRTIVSREVAKELAAIEAKLHGNGDPTALLELPMQGVPCTEILQRIQLARQAESAEYDAQPQRRERERGPGARGVCFGKGWACAVGLRCSWAGKDSDASW